MVVVVATVRQCAVQFLRSSSSSSLRPAMIHRDSRRLIVSPINYRCERSPNRSREVRIPRRPPARRQRYPGRAPRGRRRQAVDANVRGVFCMRRVHLSAVRGFGSATGQGNVPDDPIRSPPDRAYRCCSTAVPLGARRATHAANRGASR